MFNKILSRLIGKFDLGLMTATVKMTTTTKASSPMNSRSPCPTTTSDSDELTSTIADSVTWVSASSTSGFSSSLGSSPAPGSSGSIVIPPRSSSSSGTVSSSSGNSSTSSGSSLSVTPLFSAAFGRDDYLPPFDAATMLLHSTFHLLAPTISVYRFLARLRSASPSSIVEAPGLTMSLFTELGRGGFGCVYSALVNVGTSTYVTAVKEFFEKEGKSASTNFEQEVAAIKSIGLHANIAQCFGHLNIDKRPFILMKLYSGGSLNDFCDDFGTLTAPHALLWMSQIAQAVAHIYSLGWSHLDIKPDNILLVSYGPTSIVVLSDFGLAAPWNLLHAGGTRSYQAPEVWLTGRATPTSDWYSLAVVFMSMITGLVPLDFCTVPELIRHFRLGHDLIEIYFLNRRSALTATWVKQLYPDMLEIVWALSQTDPLERMDPEEIGNAKEFADQLTEHAGAYPLVLQPTPALGPDFTLHDTYSDWVDSAQPGIVQLLYKPLKSDKKDIGKDKDVRVFDSPAPHDNNGLESDNGNCGNDNSQATDKDNGNDNGNDTGNDNSNRAETGNGNDSGNDNDNGDSIEDLGNCNGTGIGNDTGDHDYNASDPEPASATPISKKGKGQRLRKTAQDLKLKVRDGLAKLKNVRRRR